MVGTVAVDLDVQATTSPEDELKRDPDHLAILARRGLLVAFAMASLAGVGSCRSRGLNLASAAGDAGVERRDLLDDAKADTNGGSGRSDGNRVADGVGAGNTIDGEQVADGSNPGKREASTDLDTREDANDSSSSCYAGGCGCGGCGCV